MLSGVVAHTSSPSIREGEAQSQEFKDSFGFVIKLCLIRNTTSSNRSHSLSLKLSQQKPDSREHPPRGPDEAREERKQPSGPSHCLPLLCRYPVSGVFCSPLPCATPACRIDPLSPAKTQRGLAKPESKAGEGAQASQRLHCEYYCLLSCGSSTLLMAHCVWRSDPDPTRGGSRGRQAPPSKFPVSELCNCVQVSPLTLGGGSGD